jgi:hypothetical protein
MRVCYFALGIELNGDLAVAFEARDGIYGDGLAHDSLDSFRLQSG